MKRVILLIIALNFWAACTARDDRIAPELVTAVPTAFGEPPLDYVEAETISAHPFATTEDLLEGLRGQGLTIEVVDTMAQGGFFGVPLQIVAVNEEAEASLRLYVFADEAAATLAAAGISPDGSEIDTKDGAAIVDWVATPHFFLHDQVIVNYTGDEPIIMQALENVFGPQFAGGNPVMVQPEPEELAHKALQTFLTQLNLGNYEEAAFHYGGDYDWLREVNPDVPADAKTELLAQGCELNGLVCLNIAGLELVSVTDDVYTFSVQFAHEDGSLFELSGCCGDDSGQAQDTFEFRVVHSGDQYLVQELPPYRP